MSRLPLLAAVVAATVFSPPRTAKAADTMRPGLWEISSTIQSAQSNNGQAMAAIAEAQKQLSAMPAEQRKMIEAMLARQGIGMSVQADGVKISYCITKEMAARREFPTGQQGQCTSTSTPTATGMQVRLNCANPPSSGSGQVTLQGDTAYTAMMNVTSTVRGKPESMTVQATGRWLAAGCGAKGAKGAEGAEN